MTTDNLPQDLLSIIERRGGVILPEHTDPWTRHLISQATSSIEIQRNRIEAMYLKENGLSLHAAVFNSLSPEAFSSISSEENSNGDALIGVSYGFIFNAACLVSLMLARNDMFVEVGDPTIEKSDVALSYIPSNLADSGIHPAQPNCPIRKAFSVYLLSKFIDSIFFHEATHLIRGHLGLVRKNGVAIWAEKDQGAVKLPPLARQALEFDADSGAIEESCDYFFLLREKIVNGILSSPDASIAKALALLNSDIVQAARYIFMSMYLPLRMFEVDFWMLESQEPLSHPAQPIRMLFLVYIFSVSVLSDDFFCLSPEKAKETALEWAIECERNYMALQDRELAPDGLASAWNSPEASQYIDSIRAEYLKLEPLLAPHVIEFSFKGFPMGRSSRN
ncbi:hypothetical protein [Burkholderia vietnamiensis]|uniref:hypothetical protein n=1 Tax=Burkholderia vietnamiensis TaxID=60552 RepID=UPI0012DB6D4E|nr:hypothetical protein [Burkholderia vietnamiensis]